MAGGSVWRMEVLGLLFVVALASAAEVQEVAVQKSVLDVYASSSHRPSVHGVDLYQGPVIVLANTSDQQHNDLVAYYADNGIRSIVDSRKFQPLFQLLRSSPNASGLVIGYQGLGDNGFLLKVVRDFVLPDNFKLYDLLRESVYTVPVVYIAPKGVFNNHSFPSLEHVARFVIDDFNIDQVPVNNSQSTSHHPSKVSVVLIPVFTRGHPYFQSPGFNPFYYPYPGSLPFNYQNPTFFPYSYHSLNNRGRNSFPFFDLLQGYNPVGYLNQSPYRYPYSRFYHSYPSNIQYSHGVFKPER